MCDDDLTDGDPIPVEPGTPSFLFDVAYGCGVSNECLPRTLAMLAENYGVLDEQQFRAAILGHAQGVRDRVEWGRDGGGAAEYDTREIPL